MDRIDSKLLAGLGLMSVISLSQINAETMLKIISSLSLLQFIVLRLRGSVLIDWARFDGWKKSLPFYIINCPQHGYQLSYPHGYHDILLCPRCVESNVN
ncbi:MAG: hypothetical protein ABSA11_13685 [Candidatus Bathyarchaeia archaeon]